MKMDEQSIEEFEATERAHILLAVLGVCGFLAIVSILVLTA